MSQTHTINNKPYIQPVVNQHPCAQRDYTLILDKSGSMATRDMPNNKTRWTATQESTFALAAKVAELDPDGIDIWLFSNDSVRYHNVSPEKVQQIFQENEPCGGTAMAEVLNKALDAYFVKRDAGQTKPNGEAIFVVTDGEPDNKEDVIKTLSAASFRLRPNDNLAVNFIQVGHDQAATQFLDSLDTGLAPNGKVAYDFIKTIKIADMERQGLTQTIFNLINETAKNRMAALRS